ncbi:unnamed protein product [Mytilus edulis]|uniref:BED-type domain-containing protein n=1 Tax=Mytilus edulis TaxID=6550 RepID=A0A8S3QU93_MYTED|nr:unnamed protein product [Mytilus edulis]
MSSKSVLEHFTVPDDFQNGNTFKGKCMHCGTLISGSYKVTSNFVTHMKRKHRDLYILHSENKEIQPTLTQCIKKSVKYSPSDPKQLEMTNALIMFIAGDLLPLSIVESEEFKNLMEKADTKYQVPSRKHLSSKFEKLMMVKYPELKKVIYGDIIRNSGNVDPFDTVHAVGESQAVLHVNQEIKYESTTVQPEQLNLITLQLSNETVNSTFQDIFAFTTGLKSPPPLRLNPEPSIAFLHVENLNHRLEKKKDRFSPVANTCIKQIKKPCKPNIKRCRQFNADLDDIYRL